MDTIKKRKLALRKQAQKVFKEIVMRSEILSIGVNNDTIELRTFEGTPFAIEHTGIRTVTFRIFQK